MSKLIGIYGASGFGREVLPTVRRSAAAKDARLAFIDDGLSVASVNGYPVFDWDGFLKQPEADKTVAITIADSRIRAAIEQKVQGSGIGFLDVCADNNVLYDELEIGAGAILQPFVTITSNVRIGRQFHANIYSYVGHDCVIGDYVTFAPGVKCNGNVHIEDHAYIGTGAILKQGTPDKPLVIGKGATVGMGAVVTRNVAPGETVVGNPARPMVRG